MFGDEWAAKRTFPNTPIDDGESISFDNTTFTVIDLGPSESPHDSPWVLGEEERAVFLGDQVYDHRHCYLADGFHRDMAREHREPAPALPERRRLSHRARWPGQSGRLGLATNVVKTADWSSPDEAQATVVAEMKRFLPSDELLFLMELSIAPVAAQLGVATATG